MNNLQQLKQASEMALNNFANAYPVKTKTKEDIADEIIDEIEEEFDLHVCNFSKTDVKRLRVLLEKLEKNL